MLKIGLTGGIGSGKSMVTELFSRLGIPVIDADVIARDLTLINDTVVNQIIDHFGPAVVTQEKSLNRKALRDIIFSQPNERNWLEELLHPLILQTMQQQAAQVTAPYCLLVAPLLLEASNPHDWVDRVLVVDSSEQNQIQRTMQRDKVSEADVLKIMASQLSRKQRLARADDVIENEGDLSQLTAAVRKVHERYLKIQ